MCTIRSITTHMYTDKYIHIHTVYENVYVYVSEIASSWRRRRRGVEAARAMATTVLDCKFDVALRSKLHPPVLPTSKRGPRLLASPLRFPSSPSSASQNLAPAPPVPVHRAISGFFLPFCLSALLLRAHSALALDPLGSIVLLSEGFDTLSRQEMEASSRFSNRVDEAIAWLEKGKQAQAQGDFQQALLWYTQVIEKYGDLALAEYARVGRAISLYEVGDKEEAFVEMEDVSVSLKGYPEIHAALAAVLYTDKNSPIPAEQQFTIATLLDPHYIDLSYVKYTKHWPPNLIKSLERFINFQ